MYTLLVIFEIYANQISINCFSISSNYKNFDQNTDVAIGHKYIFFSNLVCINF